MEEILKNILLAREGARTKRHLQHRPLVTVAYAQSLDGSIARAGGQRIALSGPEALHLTHALRASHDSILVGIGTVLSDDPQLTVRLADGISPRRVVVDSRLRTPETARMFATTDATDRPSPGVWIAATAAGAIPEGRARLEARGARVMTLPSLTGGWVDLGALLGLLHEEGVASVMVEGGARIITSFVQAGLADFAVVTIAPRLLGGLAVFQARGAGHGPRLAHWVSKRVGDDLLLWGELLREPEVTQE